MREPRTTLTQGGIISRPRSMCRMPKRGQKLRRRLLACLAFAALSLSCPPFGAVAQLSPATQPAQNPTTVSAGSERCVSCHKEAADAIADSLHAKAEPGQGGRSMTCEDCHGAGTAHVESGGDPLKIENPATLSPDARNAMCSKCHAAQAGPFTHEHPVVKIESCLACHSAHVSRNAHLLAVSDVNTLCQQCHSLAASPASSDKPIHDPAEQSTPCTNCHVHIHGSNVSNVFRK